MLLVGMVISGLAFGVLLAKFSQFRLIQVVQGSAMATMALNIVALWKQEARDPARTARDLPMPTFRQTWDAYAAPRGAVRFLVAVCLGTAAFNMQDIILEPYGGEVMHMSVGATTSLTAMMATGALLAFALAARALARHSDPCRLAAYGALLGVFAFALVIFAEPMHAPGLFRAGGALIGFSGGLFSVGTLAAAINRDLSGNNGLTLGAWGAAQATAGGLAIALGGALRDGVSALATAGAMGPALDTAAAGYGFVYHLEIGLLFMTLVAIGPLVGTTRAPLPVSRVEFGMAGSAGIS
jgi:BCD family chlorophyll transporter-like MFS transporter